MYTHWVLGAGGSEGEGKRAGRGREKALLLSLLHARTRKRCCVVG